MLLLVYYVEKSLIESGKLNCVSYWLRLNTLSVICMLTGSNVDVTSTNLEMLSVCVS
jgi:hypothetical protein